MLERLGTLLLHALQWSERYTKTNMVYLAHGGFWLAVGYGIATVTGLITVIALANFTSKEVYGTYQFIISGASILSTLTLTGIGSTVMRAVAQGSESALRYGVHIRLIWSLTSVAAGSAVAAYYYATGNTTLALSFLLVGMLAPLIDTLTLARVYLLGKKLFRESMYYTAVRRITPLFVVIPTLYLTNNLLIIVLAYFGSYALVSALLYWFIVRHYKLPLTKDAELSRLAKHLSLMRVVTEVVAQADKILLFHFLGASVLAAYALAQLPVVHLRSACKLALALAFPKLSLMSVAQLKQRIPHLFVLLFIGSLIVAVVYIAAAPLLFALFFPAYNEAVFLSQIFALIILTSPRLLFNQAFVIHQKTRELYISSLTHSAVRVVLLVILLPIYGIWGALTALIIANVYSLAVNTYLFYMLPRETSLPHHVTQPITSDDPYV